MKSNFLNQLMYNQIEPNHREILEYAHSHFSEEIPLKRQYSSEICEILKELYPEDGNVEVLSIFYKIKHA